MKRIVIVLISIVVIIGGAFFVKQMINKRVPSFDFSSGKDKIVVSKKLSKEPKGELLFQAKRETDSVWLMQKTNKYYYLFNNNKYLKIDKNGNVKAVYYWEHMYKGYRSYGIGVDKDENVYIPIVYQEEPSTENENPLPDLPIKILVFAKNAKYKKQIVLPKNIWPLEHLKIRNNHLFALAGAEVIDLNLDTGKVVNRAPAIVNDRPFQRQGYGIDKEGNFYISFPFHKGKRGAYVKKIDKKGKTLADFFVEVKEEESLALIGIDKENNVLIKTRGRKKGDLVKSYDMKGKLVSIYNKPSFKPTSVKWSLFNELEGGVYLTYVDASKSESVYKIYRMYSNED